MAMPDIVGQLPQLEAMCERLYVSQASRSDQLWDP